MQWFIQGSELSVDNTINRVINLQQVVGFHITKQSVEAMSVDSTVTRSRSTCDSACGARWSSGGWSARRSARRARRRRRRRRARARRRSSAPGRARRTPSTCSRRACARRSASATDGVTRLPLAIPAQRSARCSRCVPGSVSFESVVWSFRYRLFEMIMRHLGDSIIVTLQEATLSFWDTQRT